MRFLFFCVIIALELVVATASSAQTVNWGAKSALLELGMTEQQVINKVGQAPNKVEMETCMERWRGTCKTHTYGSVLVTTWRSSFHKPTTECGVRTVGEFILNRWTPK
jgi:hypothetical protein